MTMPDPRGVRWAVVGTGAISESFIADILAAGSIVSAVWGRRAHRARDVAERFGIATWTDDLGAVLARPDVDIVYIATPPAVHVSQTLAALDAGKHVLVEKPMATAAADVVRIFDRARLRDRFVMEAMWMKFNPLHRDVLARIAGGAIGTPRTMRGGFGMPFPAGGSRWSSELGGSSVLDQGIYGITLAVWALGSVVNVSAAGTVREGVDVTAELTLQHEHGSTSQIACSMLDFVDPSASISGSRGWIEIQAMFWATDRAAVHAGSVEALWERPEPVEHPRQGNGYVPMIRAVEEALSTGVLEHADHDREATHAVASVMDDVRALVFGGGE
ncbi:Gfo/Idh/MocA family protein [Plantibacter sp. 2H11-2]|uniref:Gfo/Idh/MocA family protein n=1 Tax=Plantibacter sp. 2H11-2 TaxID=3414431 RepID=UPI003CEBAE1D